jgi:hypothetical protein
MIACDQPGCTRRAELACVVGEIQKVLCIEHQARYRQAMSCGGRTITVHHGVDLEEWTPTRPIRMAPVEDVPDLGGSLESVNTITYSLATVLEQLDLSHTPPPPCPIPPTTMRVIMPVSRPLCLWPECESESKQGSCCMMHNDRLRKLYGSAARLTQAQIDAAPTAWEERMERRAAAARAQLAPVSKARAAAVVKARPVLPAPLVSVAPVEHVASSPVVTARPAPDALDVRLALVLIDAALDLILDRKIRALLAAARVVLT